MLSIFKKIFGIPETPFSEMDAFLRQFDKEHPERSPSQKQEWEKFERIKALRDPKK